MHIVLYGLGLLVTAIGFALAGYGIPINEFSLGNTLIIAGAVLTACGLVLIGLGAVVSRLRMISLSLGGDLVAGKPAGTPAVATAKPAAKNTPAITSAITPAIPATPVEPPAAVPRPEGRVTFPTRPMAPAPEIAAEPRLGAATSSDFDDDALPPRTAMPRLPEPPLDEPEPAEAPSLSPPPPPRGSERVPFSLSRSNVAPGERPFAASAPEPRIDQGPAPAVERPLERPVERAPERPPERFKAAVNFDTVWPSDRRPARPAPEPSEPARQEPAPLRPEPPLAPGRGYEPPAVPRRADPPLTAPPPPPPLRDEPPRAIAILKSGVVDGMAYTLYADGSIEAQLPQGTVRFGSIAELRDHIEKHS